MAKTKDTSWREGYDPGQYTGTSQTYTVTDTKDTSWREGYTSMQQPFDYEKWLDEFDSKYNSVVDNFNSVLKTYESSYGKTKSNKGLYRNAQNSFDQIKKDIDSLFSDIDASELDYDSKQALRESLNELLAHTDSAALNARSVTAAYNNPATQRIMQQEDADTFAWSKYDDYERMLQSMPNRLATQALTAAPYDYQGLAPSVANAKMEAMPEGNAKEAVRTWLDSPTGKLITDSALGAEIERLKGISVDTAINSVRQTISDLDEKANEMKRYWDEQAYLNDNSGSAPDYAEYEKLLEERAKYESILDDLYNDEDSDEMSVYTWVDDSIVRSHLSENYNAANLYDRVNKAYFDTTVDFGVEYTPNRGVKTSSYPIAQRPENYMTQEERDTFNKLWHYKSEEAATAYFERLTPTLESRGAQQVMAEAKQFTEDYPNWAWVQARGANAMKPISSAFMVGDILNGEGVRENSAANMNTRAANFVDSYVPEVTNYTGNTKFLGRDLDQFLYGTVGSTVDSAVRMMTASFIGGSGAGASLKENAQGIARATGALMSLEVFPSVVLEEKEKGRSDTQAVLLGAVRAAIEGFTEKYSVELLFSPSKTIGGFLLKGAAAEGSEEIAATVLNGVVDIIAADRDNILQEWDRRTALGIDPIEALADILVERGESTLADGMSGALSGLLFSAGGAASGAMTPTTQSAERMAQSVEVTDALVKQALAENPNNRVALKAQEDLAAGKTISAKTVQKLIESNESAYRKDDQQTIASLVASELTNRGEVTAVNETANAIAKAVVGENLSDGDLRAIENSVFGKQLYNEVTGQTKGGEWLNQLRDNLDVVEIARPQIQRETKPTAAKRVTAKNADATTKDGTAVQIVGLEAQTDGTTKVKVKGGDGAVKVMAASELELNEISKDLIEGVAKFKGAAPAIYAAYMPTNDVGTYLNDVEYIVTAANGVAADNNGATILDYLKNSKHISDLADVQIETIFNAALAEGRKALAEAQPLSTSGSGQFTYTAKRAESSLRGREAAATVFMQNLAKAFPNIDIEVFESGARMGKYIGEQGSYSDGKIRIDLNAGKNFTYDVAESAMLRTLSHELTHHLQRTAPKQYAALKAFVTKHLAEWNGGTELDDLISAKQRRSGGKLSYAAALDEVVADSCEMMLKNSAAVKQLAVENKGLFSKIRDFVKKFLSDLRRAFAGVEANDAAARYLKKFETEMQKLWDEAFTASVQNAKTTAAEKAQKNTAPKDDVQYLARGFDGLNDAVVEDLLDRSYYGAIDEALYIPVRKDTPQLFIDVVNQYTGKETVKNLQMIMRAEKAKLAQMDASEDGHDMPLTSEQIVDILNRMDNKKYIQYITWEANEKNKYRFAMIVSFKYGGQGAYALIPMDLDQNKAPAIMADKYPGGLYNIAVTIFNQESLGKYFADTTNIVLYDKKIDGTQSTSGRLGPSVLNAPSYESIIAQREAESQEQNSDTEQYSERDHIATRDSLGNELSEQQQKFFAKSKAVDRNGKLVLLYHGTTNGGFTVFDSQFSDDKLSLFAADNLNMAFTYSGSKDVLNLPKGKPAALRWTEGSGTKGKGQVGVYQVYYNLTNPLIIDGHGENWDNLSVGEHDVVSFRVSQASGGSMYGDVPVVVEITTNGRTRTTSFSSVSEMRSELTSKYNSSVASAVASKTMRSVQSGNEVTHKIHWSNETHKEVPTMTTRDLAKKAKAEGYDGLIVRNIIDSGKYGKRTDSERGTIYVAFDSNQIKSVDNKNPTLHKDIRYSERDYEAAEIARLEQRIAALEQGKSDAFLAGQMRTARQAGKETRRLTEKIDTLKGKLEEAKQTAKDTKKASAEERNAANLRAKNLEAQIKKLTKEAEASGFLAGEMSVARQAGAEIRNREEQIRKLKAELADRKAAYSANLAKFREGRDTGTYRERVVKRIRNLQDMLITNSDKKHIPEMLKEPLGNFLLALDTSSATKLKGKGETKGDADMYRRAVQLQKALERARNNTDEGGYLDLPDEFMDEFDLMLEQFNNLTDSGVEGIADAPINQMNSKQLQYLNFVLRTLQHSINGMNKMLATARYQTVAAAAESTIQELDQIREYQIKKGIEWLKSATAWKNTTPVYAFDRMGEAGKELFRAMWDAQGDFAFSTQELLDFRNSVVDNKQVRKWSSNVQTIELSDNRTVRMTTAQMMAFYCLAQRQQALDHLKTGGMRVANIGYGKNPIQQARAYHLSVEDITKIAGMVKGEAKTVADKIQRYMTERGSEWGNEISMARFGYRAFTEPVYFPIRTESSQIAKDTKSTQENSINRLLNMGFTKAVQPNAKTCVVVDNIFDIFSAHMSDMAKYHAFALPVLDMIKWYDYSVQDVLEDGVQRGHRAVKTSIESAYGKDALHYISTFLEDVNGANEGGRIRSAKLSQKFISHYKASAVGANLRVAIQQPTSYWRAAAVLDPKYLAIGEKVMWHNAHKIQKELNQYTGIAIWKELGFRDFNVGRNIRDQISGTLSAPAIVYDKVMDASMKLAAAGDTWTWCRLWEACKAEVKATKKLSGEALLNATAERFNDVIARTQVVDSVMTRSHTMRSTHPLDQFMTPFMAEPTLSYNVVASTVFDYATETRKSNRQTAWKKYSGKMARAFGVFTVTALWTGVFQSLADAFRDDDDYEEFYKKFLDALLPNGLPSGKFSDDPKKWIEDALDQGNFLSNMNIANNIPGLHRELLNVLKGFGSEAMWSAGIENFYKACLAIYEKQALDTGKMEEATDATYKGNMTWWGAIQKALQSASQISGLPIYNLTRDATALFNTTVQEFFGRQDIKILTYDPGTEGRIANAYADGFLTFDEAMAEMQKFDIASDVAYEKLMKAAGFKKYDALKDAIANGGDVKAVMDELIGYGIKEDLVESNVKSAIKDLCMGTEDTPPSIDKKTAKNMLVEYLGMSFPEAHYAVEAYGEDNFSKYDDIRDAILNGGDVQAAMDELVEYGTSESDVYENIRSSIKLWYQGETKDDGTVVDPIIDKDRAIELLVQYGDRDEEEATELVTGWSLTVETGMKDDDVKTAFLHDELSTDEAIDLRMTYYGQTEEEAADTLAKWMFEDEYGYSFDDVGEEYKDGNLSADELLNIQMEYGGKKEKDARASVAGYTKDAYKEGTISWSEAEAILTNQGGMTKEAAQSFREAAEFATSHGWDYDSKADLYRDGEITKSEVKSALTGYGGMTDAEAEAAIAVWDYQKSNPSTALDSEQIAQYIRPIEDLGYSVKDAGISDSTFYTYKNNTKGIKGVDADGDGKTDSGSKKSQILVAINNLPISSDQKDVLYYLNDWSASKIWEAPWH